MKYDVIDNVMATYDNNENKVCTIQQRVKVKRRQFFSMDVGKKQTRLHSQCNTLLI
jgi:hypothetical protein